MEEQLMNQPVDQRARRRLGAVCSSLVLACLLSSCATPGTKVQVDRSGLMQLKRLGVTVVKDDEFSVVLARDQPFPPQLSRGCVALGCLVALVDLAVMAVHRSGVSSMDSEYATQMKPALGGFDAARLFAEGLLMNDAGEQRLPVFVSVSAEEKNASAHKELDGVLEIHLKQWGLRRCGDTDRTTFKPEPSAKLQVSFYIKARIIPAAKTEPVWERQEFYADNECRTLYERSSEGLLAADLARAIEYLSGKMANEIRFP